MHYRHTPGGFAAADQSLIAAFLLNALVIIGLPTILAAVAPRELVRRLAALAGVIAVLTLLVVSNERAWLAGLYVDIPHTPVLLAALGLALYFFALGPIIGGVLSLSVMAPMAAMIAAAATGGYLAMEHRLGDAAGGVALALCLAFGASTGAGVGADLAKYFSAGANVTQAAGRAAHEALAPTVFSIIILVALFAVYSLNANFGAVDWSLVAVGLVAGVASTTCTLFIVAAAGAQMSLTEETATIENRRRRWFVGAWRPVRMALPPSTAFAAAAIAGILAVVAAFDGAFYAPLSFAFFLALVWAAAAIVFVSLRTSLLIVSLLALSSLMSNFFFDIIGFTRPSLLGALAALALNAVALGQLTVSWRDVGEKWRNARDIAENAMSDGMRRYVVTLGYGAAVFFTAAVSGVWGEGGAVATYFVLVSAISLIAAPAFMTAMSARYSQ